jgi:hypothetical protein
LLAGGQVQPPLTTLTRHGGEARINTHRWVHPSHRFPTGEETRKILLDYQRAHPHSWKRIASLLGFPANPADPHWAEVAAGLHAVAVSPRPNPIRTVMPAQE